MPVSLKFVSCGRLTSMFADKETRAGTVSLFFQLIGPVFLSLLNPIFIFAIKGYRSSIWPTTKIKNLLARNLIVFWPVPPDLVQREKPNRSLSSHVVNADQIGWPVVMGALAIAPAVGIYSMVQLRKNRLASNRNRTVEIVWHSNRCGSIIESA